MLTAFDAKSFYPSAMDYSETIYLKIKNRFAFTKDKKDILNNSFNTQYFTKGSAIVTIKGYNPKDIILQYMTATKKVLKNREGKRLRTG